MFKVKNKDTRATSWRRSGAFIFIFKHISHLVLVFLLLTLSRSMPAGFKAFIQINIFPLVKSAKQGYF